MAQKFAVFDIDGTLIRTSLFLQTVDQLIIDGHLPADARVELDEKLEAYQSRQHSDAFPDYVNKAVDLLFGNIKGVQVSDYRAAVDMVVARGHARTYVYTRELAKSLKEDGYFLIALSGSEMYAVQQFASHYGFDIAHGQTYQHDGDSFSGEISQVVGAKDHLLQQLIAEHRLSLEGSLGIGDSGSDSQMLELVEQPIAFNPDQRLFKHAQERGWKIVIERKNMIYELDHVKHEGDDHGSYILAQTNVR